MTLLQNLYTFLDYDAARYNSDGKAVYEHVQCYLKAEEVVS
jgi:hypothetical protein